MPKVITLSDVQASFNREVKNQFIVTWFGRPLANLFTPAFYNSGWTADGVTYLRMAMAGGALGLVVIPGLWTGIAAALVFYLCFVLDCVDGNLARLRGSVTYYGKFIDGLSDFVFVLGAPVAVGIALWLEYEDGWWLLAGCMCTIVSTTSQMVRSRLSFFREWMINQSGPIDHAVQDRAAKARRWQNAAAVIYVNGTFFTPLLLAIPDTGRAIFLVGMLAVQAAPEVLWLAGTMAEARIILARGRRSIHSPPEAESRLAKAEQ